MKTKVKKSWAKKLKGKDDEKVKQLEDGTEVEDKEIEHKGSILNFQEMQDGIRIYMTINGLLQIAHASELSGNRNIAVSHRIEVAKR